ncbi:hypothetical protein BD777DRAFT_121723 [Yarrowia lipolytica]|nr:hypothetical protein BD777DRAFT_121723 [Yarrowia lipolytica]
MYEQQPTQPLHLPPDVPEPALPCSLHKSLKEPDLQSLYWKRAREILGRPRGCGSKAVAPDALNRWPVIR